MSRDMGMDGYDYEPHLDHLDFPRRRPSISGTASCTGCHDPTCGCMEREDYGWDGTYPEEGDDDE